MLEIRKTETYAHWIDNLRDLQARARVQGGLLVKVFLSFELITAPAIECTLLNVDARLCFCWLVVTKLLSPLTST